MPNPSRAVMRISIDNATVTVPAASDYLYDMLATLERIEQALNALLDAVEAK